MVARGDPSSLWLLLVGLTRSRDRSRVPPLKHYMWRLTSGALFDKDSHVITMFDGTSVYEQTSEDIDDHYVCNH